MAITLTWPLTSDGAGAVTYTANNWRTLLTNLFTEGILGAGSFAVTERALGANMTLDIAAGVAVLAGDDAAGQGNYLVEATETLSGATITTADATNPRIDVVGIQLRDPSEGGAAGRDCIFSVVAGTAAASPSVPATPDSFLPLAQVLVPAAATSIEDGDISDVRAHSTLAHEVVDTNNIVDAEVAKGVVAVASLTSSLTGLSTGSAVDITGLSATFTAAADRRYRTTVMLPRVSVIGTNTSVHLIIADGSGTQLQQSREAQTDGDLHERETFRIESGLSGSTTRKARITFAAGTSGSVLAFSDAPAYLVIEDVGPA